MALFAFSRSFTACFRDPDLRFDRRICFTVAFYRVDFLKKRPSALRRFELWSVGFGLALCVTGTRRGFPHDSASPRSGSLLVYRLGFASIVHRRWPCFSPAATAKARADRHRHTRAKPCPVPRATSTLGTFYPTPYVTVAGNVPVGVGYTPLESYGDQTLALYGPLSPMRAATAPILTYMRGYDGRTRLVETASFSYPNLPALSPVRYPTVGNYYYGPRVIRTLPWGQNAINWIDQN